MAQLMRLPARKLPCHFISGPVSRAQSEYMAARAAPALETKLSHHSSREALAMCRLWESSCYCGARWAC